MTLLTQGRIAPRCHLNGKTIKSFDENIMKVDFTPCKYVLAKDCTTKQLFTVYARPTGEHQKDIEVRLLKHVIVLPSEVSRQSAHMIVDGQKQTLNIDEIYVIRSAQQAIAYVKFDGAKIVLRAPHHGLKVATDGKRIKVEVSNMWKGRVCGICGEMIKNKKSQLMGPNKCIQPNPQALVESYMVEQCQKVQEHKRKPICLTEGEHKSFVYNPFQKYFTKNYEKREYVHRPQKHLYGRYGEHYSQQMFEPRFYEEESYYGNSYPRHGQLFGKHHFGQYDREYQTYGNKHAYGQYDREYQTSYKQPFGQFDREYQTYQTYGHKQPFGHQSQYHEQTYGYKPYSPMYESEQFSNKKGLKEKTIVKEMELEGERKMCFSLHPVTHCKSGFRPIAEEERTVRFHCLPAHQEEAREMTRQAENHVLYQMAHKTVTVTKRVSVHLTCVSA